MNIRKRWVVAAGLVCLLACGGSVDVGSNQNTGGQGYGGQAVGGAPRGGTSNASSSPSSCEAMGGYPVSSSGGVILSLGFGGGTQLHSKISSSPADNLEELPVAQRCDEETFRVWEGDTVDEFFKPLKNWRLTITGTSADGKVCGSLTFVDKGQPAPSPPTDPQFAYPSGDPLSHPIPTPGAALPIVKGASLLSEMHLIIEAGEPFRDWCALHDVRSDGSNSCSPYGHAWLSRPDCCVYNETESFDFHTFRTEPSFANALQCYFCPSACSCDLRRCVARSSSYDLSVKENDGVLSGTLGGDRIVLYKVR